MNLRSDYQVNEIFVSVQGEGVLTGSLATFIRLQGCTVGCPWCDTKYTWEAGGTRTSVKDILRAVNTYHVIITGGEPTLYNLDGLVVPLQAEKHFVQLETSGQNGIKGNVYPDWITWSPKQPLDYQAAFDIKENASEVKWVVDEDLEWSTVWDLFTWYIRRAEMNSAHVPYFVLMPEGCPPQGKTVVKALDWLADVDDWAQPFFRYGDRIQYRIDVR